MSDAMLDHLMKQADLLSADDQLRLASYLVEKARRVYAPSQANRKWREVRGLAKPSLFGEDAQVYISRTRRVETEHREKALRDGV